MTLQFAGARSSDERRRRRLALGGDADPVVLSLAGTHERSAAGEAERSIPGVPRRALIFWLWIGAAYVIAGVVIALRIRGITTIPELEPLANRLWRGESPGLLRWWNVFSWMVVGWISCAIGWCRSQSQLDFDGRFQIWARAAGFSMVMIFCSVTGIHEAFAECLQKVTKGDLWRPEISSWVFPLLLISIPIGLLVDRDLRRNRAGVILFRLATTLLLANLLGRLWFPEWNARIPDLANVLFDLQFLGSLTMALATWCQLRFVIYENCDPPLPAKSMQESRWFGWVSRIPLPFFRRSTSADGTSAKKKRGSKEIGLAEESAEEEDESGKKSRRKSATTKSKRASKPRVRLPSGDEEVSEELSDESDESSSGEEFDSSDDEDEETSSTNSRSSIPAPHLTHGSHHADVESSDEDDDGDDEGSDDDEGPRDQLKGLSKRQKRELRRQNKQQKR